jgi:hypothetical protein
MTVWALLTLDYGNARRIIGPLQERQNFAIYAI